MNTIIALIIIISFFYIIITKEKKFVSDGNIVSKKILLDEIEGEYKYILEIFLLDSNTNALYVLNKKNFDYFQENDNLNVKYRISKWDGSIEIYNVKKNNNV